MPQTGQYVPATDTGRYDGIGKLTATERERRQSSTAASEFSDTPATPRISSRWAATAPESATGQFKTPTLRNVSKTAPYMHDGAYQTLWDVVNHYNFGGATGQLFGRARIPRIAPLMLTDAELGDLVEFLSALEDGAAAVRRSISDDAHRPLMRCRRSVPPRRFGASD